MLRLSYGLGYANISASESQLAGFTSIHGLDQSLALDIGGAVNAALTLHGRMALLFVTKPAVTLDGHDIGKGDNSMVSLLLGPAISYYAIPANIYVTTAIGLSWLRASVDDAENTPSSGLGFALNADVGKEWWVSDNWGLGLAARLWYTYAPAEHVDGSYSLVAFALVLSATFQ